MKRNQKGQALVETSLAIGLLILMVLGLIEFGYTFFSLGVVANATREGARSAAATQDRDGPCGKWKDTNTANIRSLMTSQLLGVISVTGVTVAQCTVTSGSDPVCSDPPATTPCPTLPAGAVPVVKVTMVGTLPRLFGFVASSSVTRAAMFRDEVRPSS